MAPQLAGIYHEPLFQMFLNVRKAYDSLYRTRCTEVLRGYGLGANLQRLLERYWNDQKVVPRAGGYYGQPFKTERGGDPGGPGILHHLQHIGQCGSAGHFGGGLWTPRRPAWAEMGVRGA